ncbi:MAG: GNAT family N-acetyltransferase [Pseudomonadota bacterium]
MTPSVQISEFTPQHIHAAAKLSASVGWPHRLEDWAMLHTLSKGQVALFDGRVVGTAFRADFGATLSCVNMIMVAEDMRGQGLGYALTESVMSNERRRAYRLVSTSSGKPMYRKLGFTTAGHILQMQGYAKQIPRMDGASDANTTDLSAICKLDATAFGGNRQALLHLLSKNGQLAVIRDPVAVTSFAAMRRFGHGYVVGPVVAYSTDSARALISHLASKIPREFLRLDVSEHSRLGPWLTDIGLSQVDRPTVMQRGNTDVSPTYFALCSQALG